jgi:hypothetical protein
MTWDIYQVIFKAAAPIHIGYRQIGILNTTRYYINGRAIWGAITANLTRTLKINPSPGDYLDIGKSVKENIRSTYFFPSVEYIMSDYFVECKSMKLYAMMPRYNDKNELIIGKCSKEDFEQKFIGSYTSTALSDGSGTAEEGSLHEIELIMDKMKNEEEIVPVYWSGYLFVNCGIYNKSLIETTLKNISTGGDRNYGFGKMELLSFEIINPDLSGKRSVFSGSGISVDNNLNMMLNSNVAVPGHVDINGFDSISYTGTMEPVVGLMWGYEDNSKKGAGQQISKADLCFVPGTRFKSLLNLHIGEYGIWKKVN